jgi:hypothetical protein
MRLSTSCGLHRDTEYDDLVQQELTEVEFDISQKVFLLHRATDILS